MASSAFEHEPLINEQQFRLLKLVLPGSSAVSTTETCETLIEVSVSIYEFPRDTWAWVEEIQEYPAYTALSYMWGPITPHRTILVNGKPFTIRENLWRFLENARRNDLMQGQYLWVDQICIDQVKRQEIHQQIQLMHCIYKRSTRVIAWIGVGDGDCKAALEFSQSGLATSDQTIRITKLLSRPYWRRLWVIQELSLSNELEFRCGELKFDLNLLHALEGKFDAEWDASFFGPLVAERLWQSRSASIYGADPEHRYEVAYGRTPLQEIIVRFHGTKWWECQKPHDGVYGLMGLVNEADRLKANYDESEESLLRRVMQTSAPLLLRKLNHPQRRRINSRIRSMIEVSRTTFKSLCVAVRLQGSDSELFRSIWQEWLRDFGIENPDARDALLDEDRSDSDSISEHDDFLGSMGCSSLSISDSSEFSSSDLDLEERVVWYESWGYSSMSSVDSLINYQAHLLNTYGHLSIINPDYFTTDSSIDSYYLTDSYYFTDSDQSADGSCNGWGINLPNPFKSDGDDRSTKQGSGKEHEDDFWLLELMTIFKSEIIGGFAAFVG